MKTNKKGISLIVLVITIIVMIILATAIIITLNNSGIINRSSEAVFKQNIKNYQSELGLYLADELAENPKYDYKTLNADDTTTPSIADVIESINDADKTEFIIQNGELIYVGLDENKKAWAEEVGLKTQLPDRPLTEAEYNQVYEEEIEIALKYGEVVNGRYNLKGEYDYQGVPGTPLPEEAQNLVIPYGVTSIRDNTFYGQSITSITLPQTIKRIEQYAFYDCNGLTTIEGLEYVSSIETCAFWCCSLKQIELSTSVSISESAFAGNDMTSIDVFDGMFIYDYAFSNSSLTSINIHNGVRSIYIASFSGCTKLESIIIPKTVTIIEDEAFYNCTSLATIYYEGTEEEWAAISIGVGNEALTNANIVYNYTGE